MADWRSWGLVVALAVTSVGLVPLGAPAAEAAVNGWPDEPTSHWDAENTACADVMFVGVRGSGEESAYGAPVESIRDGVRDGFGQLPGVGSARTVREVYLEYPASAVEVIGEDLERNLDNALHGIPADQWVFHYLDSVEAGAVRLHDFLNEQALRCPDEKWVLAGYSQGSLVINMVLPQFADYSRYGGVFLLANPGQQEGQPVTDLGTAPDAAYGIGNIVYPNLEIPSALNGLVFSECDIYDAVCDIGTLIESVVAGLKTPAQLASDGFAVHTGYDPAILRFDSKGIVEQIMGMPIPLQDSYTITVDPGEEFSGSVGAKPTRAGVNVTWRIKPGTAVPPGTVTDDGILVATNGSYVGQVPEGKHVVTLEAQGEFPEHNRTVTLTIQAGDAWQPVVFGDPQLELCIRAHFQEMTWYHEQYPWLYPDFVEPAYDQPLMPSDLAQLDRLECDNLTSLEGLQWATGVTSITVENLQTSDIGPMSPLTKLSYLSIYRGLVSDLTPLANSVELYSLALGDVPVTDISALENLTELSSLSLSGTDITDLSPLADLVKLYSLGISDNPRLSDVTALAGLTELSSLSLRENPKLTSIASLRELEKLDFVDLWDSDLTSLDGLQNKPELTFLQADRNRISSLAPLAGDLALRDVKLSGNLITSVAPLAGKNNLEQLEINDNRIVDLTPVSNLPKLNYLEVFFNRITDLSMFTGNTVVRTVAAGDQRIERETASVGDIFTLPVIRSQDGATITPTIDTSSGNATGTLTGNPATGMTLTLTGPGYLALRWDDGSYFSGQWVIFDVTGTKAPLSEVERLFGPNRYSTSAAMAREFNSADTVYISSGMNYPDALSAAPAAVRAGAPLLLTNPTSLPTDIAAEITRLHPSRIVILGGTGTVSADVEAAIEGLYLGKQVERIAGANRLDTSRRVSLGAYRDTGAPTVFIATGANFPDALAAGPAASEVDAPIVLVNGTASSLDADTKALLQTLGTTKVYVLGGPTTVSAGIEASLRALPGMSVERLAGDNRYSTAVEINDEVFEGASTAYLATGLSYPDALSGAALAGAQGAPLYTVRQACIPQSTYNAMVAQGVTKIVLLGSSSTLSAAVASRTVCT